MHALFRTFFRFWHCKNYFNPLRFDRVAVKCTLLHFINDGKNVGFNFFHVRCAHKSGDAVNFTTVACRISSRLKWYKNYKKWLRLAKVIVKNKLPLFMVHCVENSALPTSTAGSGDLWKRKPQQITGCIVWNAHNRVLGSKRLAVHVTV